jgi:hypothetical protein
MFDLIAKIFTHCVMTMFFHLLFEIHLQTNEMKMNELNERFNLKNLRRYCFEKLVDYAQILLLKFHKIVRHNVNVVRTIMQHVSCVEFIRDRRFDDCIINKFNSRKTHFSR